MRRFTRIDRGCDSCCFIRRYSFFTRLSGVETPPRLQGLEESEGYVSAVRGGQSIWRDSCVDPVTPELLRRSSSHWDQLLLKLLFGQIPLVEIRTTKTQLFLRDADTRCARLKNRI